MIRLKNLIGESFRKGKGWQVYEGIDRITTIFENGNRLTLELTFKDKMGNAKDKWRNQAAAKWVTLSRELYDDKELNEIGNEIPKSWETCFKTALNDVRLKPYIKDKTKTPVYDPVNFSPRI